MLDIIEKQKKRRNKIKYTIHGFNQIEAIKLGLSTDDLAVLRWFIDFQSTNAMERKYIEKANDMGFWVNYSTLIDALPILLSDGNLYLQRFIELEQLIVDGNFKEYQIKKRKYQKTNIQKVRRILSGPLSQILKKDDMKIIGNDKGSKIYVYVDRENYSKLLLNTNMETYLIENGIDIGSTQTVDNVDSVDKKTPEKDVDFKSDAHVDFKSDAHVDFKSDAHVDFKSDAPDSSINHSSISDSLISDSYTQSNDDRVEDDLIFYHKLKNEDKEIYLQNKFDITENEMSNIFFVMELGIEEGNIKSKRYSKGYWNYIYKTCKSMHKKKQTHNGNYEFA